MITSGFFNSVNGDRKYTAEQIGKYFDKIISNGVFVNPSTNLQVVQDEGMRIKVFEGRGWIDSHWVDNDSFHIMALAQSNIVYPRIDCVVMYLDTSEPHRILSFKIKQGTASVNPVAPSMVRDEYLKEYCLAEVYVPANSTTITQANITDTRANNDVCGWVTSLIDQVDTSTLFKQWQKAYEDYYDESTTEFEEWFGNLKENLSTSTLLRQYTNMTMTTQQNQVVIDIGIPEYNPLLDILEVFVNGIFIRENQPENIQGYTKTASQITLNLPLDINSEVYFTVFKSIDGEKAIEVIEMVEELYERVGHVEKLNKYVYYATGVDDNKKLSKIAQDFYAGKGVYAGISANEQMKIEVIGNLGVQSVSSGSGSSDDPFSWFNLGKYSDPNTSIDTTSSTRKLTFDFSNAQRISVGSQAGYATVAFNGNDLNIIGVQFVLGGEGATLQWFNGANINISESMLYMNANNTAIGSSNGGTFSKCRLSLTSVSGKANALVSNGNSILKAVDCEIIAYNGSTVSDQSVAILAEASKTESVVIVERCNIPLRTRGGFKQSEMIKINSGYCSLVSNTLGKAPALYSNDVNKCSNIGSMIINK